MHQYEDFDLNFEDPEDWQLATVLRFHNDLRPSKVFIEVPEENFSMSYSRTLASAERVAGNLIHSGGLPGDRLVIMGGNSSQYLRSWFGSALAALVEVPLNTAYEHEFLAHQLRTVSGRFAVIDDIFAERFIDCSDACSQLEHFWVVDTGSQSTAIELLLSNGWSASPWEELESEEGAGIELPIVTARDLAAIFFTSGTTGPSKGVAMSHSQMYFFAQECVNLHKLTEEDVYLSLTPMFHGNAQFLAAYPAMIAGGEFVMRRKFSASRWIDHVRESHATVSNFIGVMMDFVWKQTPRKDDADNRLRSIYAAPTASSIADGFRSRFGIETFVEAFGLTETSIAFMTPYGATRPPGAVGLLVSDWFEVRLVDPLTDREVAVGEVGELMMRSKQPWTSSMGYFGMPEKTVEAWRNLWFHTGDGMKRDDYGWYYFVDRLKDSLRRRGENISSYEIEQAILAHPSVFECAVVGVPSEIEAGEDEVLACLVTVGSIEPSEIWAWCTAVLPKFAVPEFIRFCEELPKAPSQKVQKAVLRDEGVTLDTFSRSNGEIRR